MKATPLDPAELLTICAERHIAFAQGRSRLSVRRDLAAGRYAPQAVSFRAQSAPTPTPTPDPRRGAFLAELMKTHSRSMKSFDLPAALLGSKDADVRNVLDQGRDEAEAAGFKPDAKAITLPLNAPIFNFRVRNDLTATTGTSLQYGGMTATQDQPVSFFELMRERFVLARLGATMLTGLKASGSVLLIDAGSGEIAELAENEASSEEDITLSAATITPHRISGYAEVSTQLLKQGNEAGISAILDALTRKISRRLETQAIRGAGTGDDISGLLSNASIAEVDASTLNLAALTSIEDAVGDAAEMPPAWLLNSAARKALRTASLWNDAFAGGPVLGHRTEVSGSVPTVTTSKIVFGDWSKLVVASWGALEILRNPYSSDLYGLERISFTLYCDSAIANTSAFAIGTGVVV